MLTIRVEPDKASLAATQKFLSKIPDIGRMAPDVASTSVRVLQMLKAGTPVHTGLLRQSWRADLKREDGAHKIIVDFRNTDPKAKTVLPILALGQKRHKIPRDIAHSKILKFIGKDHQDVYARQVMHPGAPPKIPKQTFNNVWAELAKLKRKLQDLREAEKGGA